MARQQQFTRAKAVAAGIGSTLVALSTAIASVQVALDDGALDAAEYGLIATAAVTLYGAVYAVWKVENKPVPTGPTVRSGQAPY